MLRDDPIERRLVDRGEEARHVQRERPGRALAIGGDPAQKFHQPVAGGQRALVAAAGVGVMAPRYALRATRGARMPARLSRVAPLLSARIEGGSRRRTLRGAWGRRSRNKSSDPGDRCGCAAPAGVRGAVPPPRSRRPKRSACSACCGGRYGSAARVPGTNTGRSRRVSVS